jgi:chemosensory pili system protein ChpA (sensor histidine kinase/response regulator)
MQVEDQTLACYDLTTRLGFLRPRSVEASALCAVIVNTGEAPVALLVDLVLDAREVIVQDAGALLRRLPGVAAATLRDDGRPMFILDAQGLLSANTNTQQSASALAKLRRRAAATRSRIFVVDDALSVRRAMQQLLEDSGFEVVPCKDGQDAIERLRDGLPSMIFTDLEMPVVNGVELTRRIRENPAWAAIPVVMITSRASDKHRELATDAGVDAFLTKPYADADLLAHARSRSRQAPASEQTAARA